MLTNFNWIFQGVYDNQIHYDNTNSFKLAINEISEKGDVGEKFFLTLHSKVAEEWQNNATVKLFTKKIGKAIIVFQSRWFMWVSVFNNLFVFFLNRHSIPS